MVLTIKIKNMMQHEQITDTIKPLTYIEVENLEAQESAEDAARLAKDTQQLKQISQDLNTLLIDQGELINDTDKNVEDAVEDVENANEELEQAKRSFFRSKLCKFTLIGILVGFVVGCLLGIATAEGAKLDIGACVVIGGIICAVLAGSAIFSIVKCKMKN